MKYMGSKARFSSEILDIILRDREPNQLYIEPFAGGMNVVCNVKGPRIANDVNKYLIAMWQELVYGTWFPQKISRREYTDIKDNKENYPDYIVGWAGFNCSYSGKFFGGHAGVVKTKEGNIRDYQEEAIKNVHKQVPKLNGVIFSNKEYFDLDIPDGSLIYCDPPYANTTKYNFDFDHDKYWQWVRDISTRNTIYVSEYNAPDDFDCVWQTHAKSSLSANGRHGGSKKSVERLFTLGK